MTVKELKELYYGINDRLTNLEKALTNHCSEHTWDRIVKYVQLTLLILLILLLKFKIL